MTVSFLNDTSSSLLAHNNSRQHPPNLKPINTKNETTKDPTLGMTDPPPEKAKPEQDPPGTEKSAAAAAAADGGTADESGEAERLLALITGKGFDIKGELTARIKGGDAGVILLLGTAFPCQYEARKVPILSSVLLTGGGAAMCKIEHDVECVTLRAII